MDKKIKDLLDKINYNSDNYKYFNDVKINKIVVSEDKNIWNIHLNCLNTIRFDILKEFIDKLSNYVNKKYYILYYLLNRNVSCNYFSLTYFSRSFFTYINDFSFIICY